MAAIFQADIWCDDCAERIKDDFYRGRGKHEQELTRDEWEEREGLDDERNYDSDEYPKDCDETAEADCPQHCGGCSAFLENDLTSYGEDYVKEAVAEARREGRTDSIDVTVWAPFYDYLDFGDDDDCDDDDD